MLFGVPAATPLPRFGAGEGGDRSEAQVAG
jgi:hypothetical protein